MIPTKIMKLLGPYLNCMLINLKNIFWDFDGVILDSMQVRDWGFREIFKSFSSIQIEEFIVFHRLNGGLSRYVKIKHFFENILGESITEHKVNNYAQRFSEIMRNKLKDKNNLILDSVSFIRENYSNYNFHIVSGSDQNELRYLCKELNISDYFISIHGSPAPKNVLVERIIKKHKYKKEETCLIGDSINDHEAANINKIKFYGYNNNYLAVKCNYINSFFDLTNLVSNKFENKKNFIHFSGSSC